LIWSKRADLTEGANGRGGLRTPALNPRLRDMHPKNLIFLALLFAVFVAAFTVFLDFS
jgi:hypothetical protein